MWVRISAAVCTILFGVLLGLVVNGTFGPEGMFVPTGGVPSGGPRDDLPSVAQAGPQLNERARLQEWRKDPGPTSGYAVPDLKESPARSAEGKPPAATTRDWLAGRDDVWSVLRPTERQEGTVNLPKDRSGVLVQPEGREWRRLHNDTLFYAGGWIILGMGLLLALFLLLRGRIPLELGFSGRTIVRFPPFERANHWMTAGSFVVMALTGLILFYGRNFLQPLTGAGLFGDIAAGSLYLHIAFAVPFVLGVAVMAIMWLRQNLPERADFRWLARFGGFLRSGAVKPPARRFNAGQKLIFWGVVAGGLLLFLSGLGLMFPFFWTDIAGMQWAMVVHGAVALLMVALILGHIYIGTVGMEGAFDAMWSGEVDRNWAMEHHRLWLAELEGRSPEEIRDETARKEQGGPSTAPAE